MTAPVPRHLFSLWSLYDGPPVNTAAAVASLYEDAEPISDVIDLTDSAMVDKVEVAFGWGE